MALNAGTDMEMVSTTYHDTLPAQVSEGHVSQAEIDKSVRRVLAVKFELGLFEHRFTGPELFRTMMLPPDGVALAREAAIRSSKLPASDVDIVQGCSILETQCTRTLGRRQSGRRPFAVGQVPVYYNRYRTGRPAPGMVDYRDLTRDPLFPFGFGLTHTSFTYEPVQISAERPAVASTMVPNTGTREGEEIVQLYIGDVACSEGARPEQELRGFERLKLRPLERREVRFLLTDDVLGFTGRDGKWRTEPGRFEIWIAPHALIGTAAIYDLPERR
jgi:hypothetical protein